MEAFRFANSFLRQAFLAAAYEALAGQRLDKVPRLPESSGYPGEQPR